MKKIVNKTFVQSFVKCTSVSEHQADCKIERVNGRVHYVEGVKQGATFVGNLYKIEYKDENTNVYRHDKMLLTVGMAIQNPNEKFDRKIGTEVGAERAWSGDTVIDMLVDKNFSYEDFDTLVMNYYYAVVRRSVKFIKTEQEKQISKTINESV